MCENPTIETCLNCPYEDCIRDEQGVRNLKYYYSHYEQLKKANRDRNREKYNKTKNAEKCKRWYLANKEYKKQYDRERYLRRKAELVK